MAMDQHGLFKRRHFTSEVILSRCAGIWLSRSATAISGPCWQTAAWRLTTPPFSRWVQAYAGSLERRLRRHLRPCTGSWRVDGTYIKVKGVWTYLYGAVDSLGQIIDFLLSVQRDVVAAKRFF